LQKLLSQNTETTNPTEISDTVPSEASGITDSTTETTVATDSRGMTGMPSTQTKRDSTSRDGLRDAAIGDTLADN